MEIGTDKPGMTHHCFFFIFMCDVMAWGKLFWLSRYLFVLQLDQNMLRKYGIKMLVGLAGFEFITFILIW